MAGHDPEIRKYIMTHLELSCQSKSNKVLTTYLRIDTKEEYIKLAFPEKN